MPLFSDASLAAEYAEQSGNGVHKIVRKPGATPITRFFVIEKGADIPAGREYVRGMVGSYIEREQLVSYEFYESTEKLRRDYPEHFAPADPHANGCPDAPGICECFAKR